MSIPMIFRAASRASSGVLARMMPPALPRPPTGTWALTATGPRAEHAAAASSGVRATLPGGIAMPSEARSSLAWYSRSFKSRLSVLAQREAPVVALHPVALRVLEPHLAEQREPNLATDCVRRAIVDRGEGVDGRAPPRGPCQLDGSGHRHRSDAAALVFGQHAPPHPVDRLALPLPVPEVDVAHAGAVRLEHDLVAEGSILAVLVAHHARR